MKFLLINGHGGIIDGVYQTKGKQYHHKIGKSIYEGVFNRIVVNQLCKMCECEGIEYANIVPELTDVTLSERVNRVNNEYRNRLDSVLIEVHANAGGGTGFEVFTSVGNTKSDPLSEVIINAMERELPELRLRKDTRDGDKDKESHFYMLRKTWSPAILIECAFMDTYEPDCRMMLETPERFSKAIFEGIKRINQLSKK